MYTLQAYETIPVKCFSKPSLGYHRVTCVYVSPRSSDPEKSILNVELQSNAFSTRHKPFHLVSMKTSALTKWEPRLGEIVEVKYVDNNATVSKSTLIRRIIKQVTRR
jgi:hypothetical protein